MEASRLIDSKPPVRDEVTLAHYVDMIRRRRGTILSTALVVLVLGCAVTALMTPVYEARAQLLVRAASPQIGAATAESPLADLLAMTQPEAVSTQILILRSEPFVKAVLAAAHAPLVGRRKPQIRVADVEDTNVIEVTVDSSHPCLAAGVANGMLDHYLDYSRDVSLHEISQTTQFIRRKARKAQRDLQDAENGLLSFRRSSRVAQLAAEEKNRTQELVDLEAKASEVAAGIARLQAQMLEARAQLAQQPRELVVSTGHENPRVAALQTKLAEALVERGDLLKQYVPGSPEFRQVDASIAGLQAQLAAEPREVRVLLHQPNPTRARLIDDLGGYLRELRGLQAEQAQLNAQLNELRHRMNQLGPWEVRLAQLMRDRDMAEKSYLGLMAELQDLDVRGNARRSTARVIEYAETPKFPVEPRRIVNLAMSLALGLLLGCCLAFLRDTLDDRITHAEEVDRLLGLPILGSVPVIAGDHRLIGVLPPYSPAAESYRALRFSINSSAAGAPVKTLAVCSAGAGEGKSTTAINLAMAMAMDGRKVILVDADLRQPSLHRLLGLAASPGLVDLLMGQCSLEDALQGISGCRVQVLTSGPVPPNPPEMLNTPAMADLIRQLRELADIVIFDTSACVPVIDAQVLGARLDGVLLVVGMGEAGRTELCRLRELLVDQVRLRVLGVVLNKMTDSADRCSRSAPYPAHYLASGLTHAENGYRKTPLPPAAAARLDSEAAAGSDAPDVRTPGEEWKQ